MLDIPTLDWHIQLRRRSELHGTCQARRQRSQHVRHGDTATDPDYGPHSPYGGCAGCLGSIVINSSTTYTKTNEYYMIGHFPRFIRRGAVNHRVLQGVEGTTLDVHQFDVIATQNPDMGWAVVFVNNFGSDQDVQLEFLDGHSWQGVIPNGTVVTWLLPSDQIIGQSDSGGSLRFRGLWPDCVCVCSVCKY